MSAICLSPKRFPVAQVCGNVSLRIFACLLKVCIVGLGRGFRLILTTPFLGCFFVAPFCSYLTAFTALLPAVLIFTTPKNKAKSLLFLAVVLSGSWLSWATSPRNAGFWGRSLLLAPINTQAEDDTSKDTGRYRPSTRPRSTPTDRPGDPFANRPPSSSMLLDAPSSAQTKVELDTTTGNYVIYEKLGELDYRPVSTMTFAEYEAYRKQKDMKDNMKAKAAGLDGESPLSSKSTIPRIFISPMFDRIFGGNYVDIRPNGSVLLDFGYRRQRVFNPAFPIRQQTNGQFLFDQQISLNAQGKIGEKLKININQDTKAAFEFDNTIKLDYTGFDHEILQKIEAGNVSLPLSNSLLRGAQNLFGLKTTMQFGKMRVVSVVSNSRSNSNRIVLKGGSQSKEVMVRCDNYEDNRHYFLGHFFRNRYDQVLSQPPIVTNGTNVPNNPGSGLDGTGAGAGGGTSNPTGGGTSGTAGLPASSVNSGIQITRVELYVTNRANNTSTLRNIIALQDLGEHNPLRNRWLTNPLDSALKPLSNETNTQLSYLRGLPAILDANQAGQVLVNEGLERGADFEVVRGARRLLQDRDFTVQSQLGYISLNTQLRDDEVLGLAMEYSFNGRVYKVGEMAEDYASRTEDQAIILKLLRPSQVRLNLPTWDLQMKNIYSLGGGQFTKDNFQMRVVYRDDSSGVDNPALPRGSRVKDVNLVQVFNLDRLDPTNELRPDGNFDYIDGVTVDARNGRIIFPVTEPFGSFLRTKFDATNPADAALANKYSFDELYRGTKSDALQAANKAKFFLVGKGQSASAGSVNLGIGIKDSAVSVFAGAQKLTLGSDYIVDDASGTLTIINPGVLNSGQEIVIQFEQPQFFAVTQKSFFGSRFDYTYSPKLNLGATILYQNERPIVRRVAIGDEPARNTQIGLDFNYKSESLFLTKMVDALPLIQTKAPSTVTLAGEYAHLFPGVNKFVDRSGRGISFIDDFEGARVPVQTIQQPLRWRLASTPQGLEGNRADVGPDVSFNDRRASVNWHLIDPLFYNSNSSLRPRNLSATDMANNYVRPVGNQEIMKGRDLQQLNLNENIFDVVYFPNRRGAYNYNPNLTAEGNLAADARTHWGGLMTDFSSQTDFDIANVEYLEFWMMSPFLDDDVGGNTQGDRRKGRIVFDLGQISEDVVRDRRFFFENGMPVSGDKAAQTDATDVGRIPRQQILNTAFDNEPGNRPLQDIGLDGLTNDEERLFFGQSFLAKLPANLTAEARATIEADPSNDGWSYFLGSDQDARDAKIIDRYSRYNNPEGNSPIPSGSGGFAQSSYTTPDMEDLNGDKSLNEVDAYYSYKIEVEKEKFNVGQNYIVDQIDGKNNSKWYLFRIPIRELSHPNALPPTGGITDFKTVKFLRMYMTGFEVPVAARFYQLQMVASQWRKYPKRLTAYGSGTVNEDASEFTVSTVNIEENGGASSSGQQKVPYTLPPGAQVRDKDITSGVSRRLNEQSMSLCINNLSDGDAKAVFKNVTMDLLNYGKIQAYVHAQTRDPFTKDKDLQVFVRVGTDFTDNFYEVSVPLSFTQFTTSGYTAEDIWKRSNWIDLDLRRFYLTKLERNANGVSFNIPYIKRFDGDTNAVQEVTVVGNPDLNNILTLMIGVRNPADDGNAKSTCVWINEFRVTDFVKNDGWAVTGTMNAKLADFATVQASGRYITPGFGGIDQRISERSRSTDATYTVSSNIQLDKFIPRNSTKVGLKVPMYVAFERSTSTPLFDPLNPDIPLAEVKEEGKLSNYKALVIDQTTRRSLNFTNVQKTRVNPGAKPKIYDIENLSASFAYSDIKRTNVTIADFTQRQINYGAGYSYTAEPFTIEPFKKVKMVSSPYLRLIKDINFTPLPASITVRADLLRNFTRQQLRSSDVFAPVNPSLLTFQKSLIFNRQYGVRWLPFRSFSVDYSANASAVVDEPAGDIRGNRVKRDSVLQNVAGFGRLKTFNQTVRFGYKLPLDKLPFTDWIQADVSYTGGINWAAAPLALQDTLGNVLQNSRDRAINGRVDLLKLYNKVKYLQKINTPPAAKVPTQKATPQLTPKQKLDAQKATRDKKAADKKERIRLENALKTAKARKASDRIKDSLALMIRALDRKEKATKVKDTTKGTPIGVTIVKSVLRTLMSVRQINGQYQITENTVLAGYRPTPTYGGLSEPDSWAPGLPFVLGSQDAEVRVRMAEANLLGRSITQSQPFQQAQTITFSANTTVEPLRDFRLRLDVRQSQTANYSEIYRFDDTLGRFNSFTPTRGGSFTTSFVALGSFRLRQSSGDDANQQSKEWLAFKEGSTEIRDRLNAANTNSFLYRPDESLSYDTISQDVLIPAFIAAYTGKSAKSVALNNFPRIPLPNWRIDYSGLSKIAAIARIFPTITLTHSYSSTYSIDRYVSSLQYQSDKLTLSNRADVLPSRGNDDRRFIPVYNASAVLISEKFAPLVGVDVRTKSKVTIRAAYNRDRAMTLNVTNAQITEVRTQDIVVGVGFAKSGVTLPLLKNKGRPIILKNELTLRADFTVRDNITIQRRAGNNAHIPTAGGLDIQLKPTANYVINQRFNIQAYFERTINQPRVSTSFLRKVTAFGFQLRYALQ